jgi:cytochrome c-type biogenesis protein CcsB
MNKIFSFLFSMFFSVLLLIMFAISIAYATFIENDFGTDTAQVLIYQARWFEILLLVGAINLIGSMFKYKLFTRHKWAILLFHLAFVCIIIGAGVTRYFGFEGSMHIREGETTNQVVSESTFINLEVSSGDRTEQKSTKVKFTPNSNNHFDESLNVGDKTVTVENEMFVPNASETIIPDENGEPVISLMFTDMQMLSTSFKLIPGEVKQMPATSLGFETAEGSAKVIFSREETGISMVCSDTLIVSGSVGDEGVKISPFVETPITLNQFYVMGNSGFVCKKYLPKAITTLVQVPGANEGQGVDAFIAKITSGNETRRVNVFEDQTTGDIPTSCTINGLQVNVSFGPIVRELPFNIMLRDFQIERYPGSRSPSSFASEITLKDPAVSTDRPFRIFMNNILNYNGYRFFQSSFDQDEKGTILSVNQDYWGTFISYLGYFLMTLGMIFTIFSKASRFQTLVRLSGRLQAKRQAMKVLFIGLILSGLMSTASQAFCAENNSSKSKHINSFDELLVQDHQGRIEPVSTLSSDLLRKISRENTWKGMSATEFFLGISANPDNWKNVPFIKVANPELQKILGTSEGFVTYALMFDQIGNYKLNDLVQQSYNKKQTLRTKLDKEIINVDERVNICYQIFNGDFLKIFPVPDDPQKTWVTHSNLPQTMQKQELDFASNILNLYFEAYRNSEQSGNWSKPDEYLGYIVKFQTTYGADIIPSHLKIRLEIFYNDWNIFGKLAKTLALLGFVLLVFHFMLIFNSTPRILKIINIGSIVLFAAFLLYTAGLSLRWYISGHAPWSNGYETMIYVGWATLLSGFIFVKRSPITLAVTSVLAAIILFVAGMSWMNPEITNLVPVLKSYWLVVHVAIITASYGFLAMGAILGMLNLVLMILRNRKNNQNISFTILEVSYIIEMAMMIGLLMLTIGAFIGGVWANESWGRYWGWDPKETWALVTILVYTVILHLRKIPGLKNTFGLSSLALVGLSSVLMTFFGVNYYLSGMHSYGQGDPPPIPTALYIAVILIFALIITAWFSLKKQGAVSDAEDADEYS